MTEAIELRIPLLNPNETEAVLVDIHVAEGQQIAIGDRLYTLETTKSAAEIAAEADGYLIGIQVAAGETLSAGDLFAYLAETPDWQPPALQTAPQTATDDQPPAGLRITDPALALARQHNLDLSQLPTSTLVTASHIRRLVASATAEQPATSTPAFDPTAMIVYGGGGHGKSVIELIQALRSYRIVGIIDDGIPAGGEILGVPILGGAEMLPQLHADGVRLAANAVGGIGQIAIRVKVFARLSEAGFTCPTLIHPTAFIEPSARLTAGVQIFPHAYVGSEAQVGFGTIINTSAVVSHDCTLGDYVNLAPGAILAGGVEVGDDTLIGMGVTVNLFVKIGQSAKIGNSATIKADVPANGIVRAGTIWPK